MLASRANNTQLCFSTYRDSLTNRLDTNIPMLAAFFSPFNIWFGSRSVIVQYKVILTFEDLSSLSMNSLSVNVQMKARSTTLLCGFFAL